MCVVNCSSSLNSFVSWVTMSAMTWVSSTATNFSFFFATGLALVGSGSVPNSFCQKLRTCFASETISSTVFLTSMKDVLASLYSLHPCLIAATQALAARRRLIGSIYSPKRFLSSLTRSCCGDAASNSILKGSIFPMRICASCGIKPIFWSASKAPGYSIAFLNLAGLG